ncbi:hypothetical protein [Pedobacter nyackensis]|uniref:Uncharacterized protein n=1 Tax=Pedobacter nyackensis TaxID=475255 RepID=A0A1W2EIU4_9SPHI|nr:hypothetical protein [Pedobacter nyackensis]SMD09256.1 hypothetical protein SAMN04488101_112104 [Pedobacter nyackensis]
MKNEEQDQHLYDPEWNKKKPRNAENDQEDTEDDQEGADDFLPSDGLVDRNIGEGSEDLYDLDDFDDDVLDPKD